MEVTLETIADLKVRDDLKAPWESMHLEMECKLECHIVMNNDHGVLIHLPTGNHDRDEVCAL